MRIFLTILFLFVSFEVFAEKEVYCPATKELVYYYKYDVKPGPGETFKASDFRPAKEGVLQPVEGDYFVCPETDVPMNGFEYWFYERKRSLPKMAFNAVTFLTKDEHGNFIWWPHEVNMHD